MYEFLDKRYAQALYDVANAKGKVAEYIGNLEVIQKSIEENKEFQSLIKHPEITIKEKKHFFINLFKGKIAEDLLTFLLLLIEKDRILFLKEKIAELKKIDLENRKFIKVQIISARELNGSQRDALKIRLKNKYSRDIILDETIDKTIIGGLIIRVGDELFDGSVKSQMEKIKNSMLKNIEVNQ